MEKSKEWIRKIAYVFLSLLMLLQIVLGLCWMAVTFWGNLQMGFSWVLVRYLIQLAVAAGSAYFFLHKLQIFTGKKILGVLYLLTIPILAQCHLSEQPYSLAGSLFLFFLGVCTEIWGKRKQIQWRVLIVICIGCISLTGISYEALLRRIVWPNFERNGYFWTVYVTDLFEQGELAAISENVDLVENLFCKEMEDAYGTTLAREQYRQMMERTFSVRTKEVLGNWMQDLLQNSCPQWMVLRDIRGQGSGYSAENYSVMQEKAPILTKYYMYLSLYGFLCMLLPGAILIGMQRKKFINGKNIVPLLLAFVFIVMANAVSMAGKQDYLQMFLPTFTWGVVLLIGWEGGKEVG